MTLFTNCIPPALRLSICIFCLAVLFSTAPAFAIGLDKYPKLRVVADQLVAENYYTHKQLKKIFASVDLQPSVLEAMQSPAEYKFTWGKYRKLFLQEDRIQQGVEFWLQYAEHLTRAEQEYGVPASVIVAIIGVESKFGKYKGKHKVLDSLATLVVGFQRRSDFFAGELKQFLVLSQENNLAASEILGSYAGAVGFPQFISSSYRAYAVDFSGDGSIDLINQPVDAIGSVANYLVKNGWQPGQTVSSAEHLAVSKEIAGLANRKRKVQYTAIELRALGAPLSADINGSEKLNVLMLDAREELPKTEVSRFYLVRAGDTACQIAEQHKVPCSALFSLNRLNSKGVIYRGQRLKLPTPVTKQIAKPQGAEKLKPAKSQTSKGASANLSSDDHSQSAAREKFRYFFTHENFYVITRYNQSVLYAMAVHHLSVAIATANKHRQRLSKIANYDFQ